MKFNCIADLLQSRQKCFICNKKIKIDELINDNLNFKDELLLKSSLSANIYNNKISFKPRSFQEKYLQINCTNTRHSYNMSFIFKYNHTKIKNIQLNTELFYLVKDNYYSIVLNYKSETTTIFNYTNNLYITKPSILKLENKNDIISNTDKLINLT